ncbi:hypothetical protein MLD38_033045 [Melastoma candidum]|uniref:Uncharacterized protein n=1 Tax=Melastoma candidum TaxID=119954 RepID=A0ACB9M5H2_9MYRT|nr:hypothetical protein MLD38_033045 [Melastoma candidum]
MDLPGLQELFSQYVQRLFAMGYFERSQFRQFYVAAVTNSGSSLESFSPIHRSMHLNLESMDLLGNSIIPNFQQLITFSEGFLQLATRLGACRVRDLIAPIIFYAGVRHQAGCVLYLKMLQSEFIVLSTCFQVICDMERAIMAHEVRFRKIHSSQDGLAETAVAVHPIPPESHCYGANSGRICCLLKHPRASKRVLLALL